jgi:hypothetical protein
VTEIARCLREDGENLEAVWQRIRRNVGSHEWEKFGDELRAAFALDRAAGLNPWSPVVVDLSDLSKPYAKQMEYLACVRDADQSSLRGAPMLNPGYWIFESYVAVGEAGDPLPVTCFPFSVQDPEVGSQNRAMLSGLDILKVALSGMGILLLDRGFDSDEMYKAFEERNLRFICRLVGNRTVLDADQQHLGLAEDVASRTELKFTHGFRVWRKHKWDIQNVRFGWRQVRLPDTGQLYTMVITSDPDDPEAEVRMMLLTNAPITNIADAMRVIRLYWMRWRAEDAMRFLKSKLGIETVRVMDFASIRRLVELTFWVIALISLVTIGLTDEQRHRITKAVAAWPTPVLLFHYRVMALLQQLLRRQPTSSLGSRRGA